MKPNKIQITSTVEGGKLKRNRKTILSALEAFEGREVTLTIERKRKARSAHQNAFYWGCVVELIRLRLLDFGYRYTNQETHDKLKQWVAELAPDVMKDETVIESTGQVLSSVKSTTDLTTSGFMDYLAVIQQFAAETLEIDIPDPDEQTGLQVG